MLQITVRKNDVINETVFGLYVCQKKTFQPEIQHVICPGIVLQHIVRCFENLKFFGFWKKLYTNLSFYFWGEYKNFVFGKSEIAV